MSRRKIRRKNPAGGLLPPGIPARIKLDNLPTVAATPGTAAYDYISGGKPSRDLKADPRVVLSIPFDEGPWVYFNDHSSMQILNEPWTPEEYEAFLAALRTKESAA